MSEDDRDFLWRLAQLEEFLSQSRQNNELAIYTLALAAEQMATAVMRTMIGVVNLFEENDALVMAEDVFEDIADSLRVLGAFTQATGKLIEAYKPPNLPKEPPPR